MAIKLLNQSNPSLWTLQRWWLLRTLPGWSAVLLAYLFLPAYSFLFRWQGEHLALRLLAPLPLAVAPGERQHELPPLTPLPWQTFQPQAYQVQAGDSLERIAQRHEVNLQTIVDLNHLQTPFIRPGEKILLPNIDGVLHQVQAGESLLGLAVEYGITLNTLLDVNDLRQANLQVGAVLFIPSNEPPKVGQFGPVFSSPLARKKPRDFTLTQAYTEISGKSRVILFPAAYGESVLAIADGKVLVSAKHHRLGNYLIVSHQDAWSSLYAHLGTPKVAVGQNITAQQPLAIVTRDTLNAQPTLYLGLYYNGELVDLDFYPPVLGKVVRLLAAVTDQSTPP